jgi:hypothetical protein
LVAQRNPERLRNQFGNPTHQTGKNLGSNSGLPQETERESDQFPAETPKKPPFGGETLSLGSGNGVELHGSVAISYALG